MPALPNVPQVLRIGLKFDLATSHGGGSRFYFAYTGGPPNVTNCNSIASGVSAAFGTDLASLVHSDKVLVDVTVTDLSSSTSAEGSWTGTVAGTRAGTPLPIDAAGCLNSVIARRYRGGKPRIFLPIGVEADLNSDLDTWTSGMISSTNAAWVAFKSALAALTGIGCTLTNHVNVSYYAGFASVQNPVTKRWRNIPTPRPGPVTPDVITSTSLMTTISQQRRRRFAPTP